MFDALERLRAKPEPVRVRIALGAAGAITLVVFAAWIVARFAERSELTYRAAGREEASPFAAPPEFPEFSSETPPPSEGEVILPGSGS